MDITTLYKTYLTCGTVSTDTRKIKPGDMFFAIKGANFDANTFAAEALERGAAAVVIDNEKYVIDHRTVCVSDTLQALQQLAAHHRKSLGIPFLHLPVVTEKLLLRNCSMQYCSENLRRLPLWVI
jgi:UDP-N-acetylmuramoyl-tripeptide--D-alanyl-D-alanine ligase